MSWRLGINLCLKGISQQTRTTCYKFGCIYQCGRAGSNCTSHLQKIPLFSNVYNNYSTTSSSDTPVVKFERGKKIIDTVIEHVSQHEPSLYQQEFIRDMCICLLKAGVSDGTLKKEICTVPIPAIFRKSIDQIEKIFSTFKQFSVSANIALYLINVYGDKFIVNTEELHESLYHLSSIPIRDLTLLNFIDT